MDKEHSQMLDLFCTAIALKEKMLSLYEEAMQSCADPVGIETFRLLRNAEDEPLQRITAIHDLSKEGKLAADACRLPEFEGEEKKGLLKRLFEEQGRVRKACLDDVAAIETGLTLENEAITIFTKQLEGATEPLLRAFLDRMIAGEREHYLLLADLKFYYVDTESWLLEKGRQELDGAGVGT